MNNPATILSFLSSVAIFIIVGVLYFLAPKPKLLVLQLLFLLFAIAALLGIIAGIVAPLIKNKMTPNKFLRNLMWQANKNDKEEITVTTDKSEYQESETITLIVKNNSDSPIWHENTCSIGPCSYYKGTLSCLKLVGIDCARSKLEPGQEIKIPYARPVRQGEVRFKFFYEKTEAPFYNYQGVLSNEILVKAIKS